MKIFGMFVGVVLLCVLSVVVVDYARKKDNMSRSRIGVTVMCMALVAIAQLPYEITNTYWLCICNMIAAGVLGIAGMDAVRYHDRAKAEAREEAEKASRQEAEIIRIGRRTPPSNS